MVFLCLLLALGSPTAMAATFAPAEEFSRIKPSYSLKARDLDSPAVTADEPVMGESTIVQTDTPSPEQPKEPLDKSQYNLFDPTPREFWRDFNPSRPGKTDTPFTIDAGSFQIEADVLLYTSDRNNLDEVRNESFNIFIPILRVGLTDNVEFQLIPEVYNIVQTQLRGEQTEQISGFGDITARVKVNFWGNEGGRTAFGVVPFIKFPTNQNNLGNSSLEGGIIFPLAIELSEQWDIGLMTQFNLNKDEIDDGYNVGFINSVALGYGINPQWGTYLELYTEVTTEANSQFIASIDTGFKYLLTDNLQLDFGVNVGLTQAADDFQPFLGISARF